MDSDVRFTFEKYSDPQWHCLDNREWSYTFVPDEIFEPALMTLQQHAPYILAHADQVYFEAFAARKHHIWTWAQTMAFVKSTWDEIDPRYGAVMEQAIDDADICLKEEVPVGYGSGICYMDYVQIRSEETINDPVCAVHESGHLMSFLMAPDKNQNDPAENVKELQSMFVQECGYVRAVSLASDEVEARGVRLHRLAYYIQNLSYIPVCLALMDKEKSTRQALDDQFHRWSVDPAIVSYLERYARNTEDKERLMPQDMHKHTFAALLAPALYKRFQEKDAGGKQAILCALYEHGADTTLFDVLTAFDIHTPDDVRVAAEETCRNFRAEVILLVPKVTLPEVPTVS